MLDPALPLPLKESNLNPPLPLSPEERDLKPHRQQDRKSLDPAFPLLLGKRALNPPLPLIEWDCNSALLLRERDLTPTFLLRKQDLRSPDQALPLRERDLTTTFLLREQDLRSLDQALPLNLRSLDSALCPIYLQCCQLQLLRKLPSETRKTHMLENRPTLLKVLVPVRDPALPLRVRKLRTLLRLALQPLLPQPAHSHTSRKVDSPLNNRRNSVSGCVWNQRT